MNDEQKLNHAFARSLSNAGLGLNPCRLCGRSPTIEHDECGYIIFCPAHDAESLSANDSLAARTFQWDSLDKAIEEWQESNHG